MSVWYVSIPIVVLIDESLTWKASNLVVMDHHRKTLDYTTGFALVTVRKEGQDMGMIETPLSSTGSPYGSNQKL